MFDLYPYQQIDYNAIVRAMKSGKRRICYCLPTGGGKSILASHLAQQVKDAGKRIMFIVDRDVLVNQMRDVLEDAGIPTGRFQSDKSHDLWYDVVVGSAQTMSIRNEWPPFDMAVIDECHVQYRKVMDRLKAMDVLVIGLTATPFAKGMGRFYDEIVSISTTNQLIDIKEPRQVLVPPLLSVGSPIAHERLVVGSSGEYTSDSMSQAIDAMVGDPVSEWHAQTLKHFGGPVPSLAFTNTIVDGEKLEERYQAGGFNWRQVSANDTQREKDRKIEDLRRHRIYGLISCTMLERGFNMPEIQCLQLFRKYRENFVGVLQMLGRGLRWAPGKDYCLVIDHAQNLEGYAEDIALFYDEGVGSLDMTERKVRINEKREREPAKCRSCGNVLLSRRDTCVTCGAEIPRKQSQDVTVAARFREIDLRRGNERSPLHPDIHEHVWENICALSVERWPYQSERARRYAYAQWGNLAGSGTRTPTPYHPSNQQIDSSVRKLVDRQYRRYLRNRKKEAVAA